MKPDGRPLGPFLRLAVLCTLAMLVLARMGRIYLHLSMSSSTACGVTARWAAPAAPFSAEE